MNLGRAVRDLRYQMRMDVLGIMLDIDRPADLMDGNNFERPGRDGGVLYCRPSANNIWF